MFHVLMFSPVCSSYGPYEHSPIISAFDTGSAGDPIRVANLGACITRIHTASLAHPLTGAPSLTMSAIHAMRFRSALRYFRPHRANDSFCAPMRCRGPIPILTAG